MTSTDILTAAENYGDAKSNFQLALLQANEARKQAMFDIGAEYIQQGGNTVTVDAAAKALGGEGFQTPTAMKAGFGSRGLSLIGQEQTGGIYEQDVAAQQRGITVGSGVREQARLVGQEIGQEAAQDAFREYQAKLGEASAGVVKAKTEELEAKAEFDTVRGKTTGKTTGKPNETKAQAAKRRASARAAANQKAKAAGKPLPYGPGGAPKPKPAPGVKPPSPQGKKGKK